MELFDLLKPHVRVRAPLRLPDSDLSSGLPSDESAIRALVDWEIVLGTDEVHQTIAELSTSERWQASLPELLSGFSSLLRDAMDLSRQLQGADDRADGSYWHQPSIKAHDQNRKFRDWTALIELTRDSWLATALQDPRKARAEVHHWLTFPYPLFRRLAFFAATETNLFEPNLALSWLLDNEGWWLWSVETERETFRLLKRLAHQLGAHEVRSFVSAILSGPPRSMYQADISAERLSQIADREIWLRLAKFQASGGRLEANASSALSSISARYPDLVLADDESDEFPVWMGPIRDFGGKQVAIPRELDALKSWLRTESAEGVATSVEWSQLCKDDLDTASTALTDLAAEGLWPEAQWRAAFQAWSDPTIAELSWDRMRDVVTELPDSILEDIVQSVSWWLQTVAKLLKNGEGAFLSIAERLIVAQRQKGYDRDEDPLFHAINHPVGQTTDAVLRWWYRQDLKDGQLLRPEVSKIFNVICNLDVDAFRYGRIVLAANVIPLFRVDRLWTVANILPNLNWSRNLEEARAQWSGFLWSPRLYPSLYACIKSEFLSTAAHYQELGELA
ncbi:MAG TPA: hypothetical protein VGU01_15640, partial [Sphingomicrobium sp.]|nr:hypothetical protein [Sphingomicrobium sp.]